LGTPQGVAAGPEDQGTIKSVSYLFIYDFMIQFYLCDSVVAPLAAEPQRARGDVVAGANPGLCGFAAESSWREALARSARSFGCTRPRAASQHESSWVSDPRGIVDASP
jgi:hypothetical protein